MSDPMTRRAAIERVVAMRYNSPQTWDLSEKDCEALRHAVQAFSDADTWREKLDDIRNIIETMDEYASDGAHVAIAEIRKLNP
jgi:hypothetical protein